MFDAEGPAMIELASDALGSCRVVALTAREAMNELPRWLVDVVTENPDVDLEAACGSAAELVLFDELEGFRRSIQLMIVAASYHGPQRFGHCYAVELSAPMWRTSLRKGYRIVLEKAAHEVVKQVLEEAGFAASQIDLRISGATFQRDQVTQYAETDWQFVERLLAEEGFSYWFDDREDESRLVIGDGRGSHDGMAISATLPFVDRHGMNVGGRSFRRVELIHELAPTGVHVRDFDIRQPEVYVEGKAGDEELTVFEYPAFVPDEASARTRAAVRLDQVQRRQVHAEAESDCMRLQPGRLVRVDGAVDDDFDIEYVITAVEHEFREATPHSQDELAYNNRVELVPSEARAVRPAVPSRPRIDGVEPAVVTGPSGEEIHVDDLARVKLRFMWDPSGITDDRSSTWARGLQWSLTGSMFLPRVGWEVATMFLDGSPDRPFVLQRLYNGTAVVPYALPAASATTAIKTVSSPGGGGINEIRLADDAGKQEMYLHAARDTSVAVGADAATKVGTKMQHDVTAALTSFVEGSHDFEVRAFRTVDVGTDYATTVKGTHANIIIAAELQSIGANRVVETSSYIEGIVAAYVLQCNQSNLVTRGAYVNLNKGTCRLMAGLATAENVAGARVERIGGSYTIEASGTFTDNPWGFKRVSAGAGKEEAGGDVGAAAPLGTIKSNTATVKSPDIMVSGKKIKIKASTLVAAALELSGGTMKSTSKTFIKADKVRVPAGGSVE